MELLTKILLEIYQVLFISSIIFMIYIIGDLIIKMYGRFKLNAETRFILSNFEKILLWISLTIFMSYLIK
jgi:ATP-dependent protease HslVU (ClpYQ) ATPase subunit